MKKKSNQSYKRKPRPVDLKTAEMIWNQSQEATQNNEILENAGLDPNGIRVARRDGKFSLLVPMSQGVI